MEQFYLIIICLILGQLCRFYPKFSKDTPKVINAFVLYISLSAVIILKVPELIKTLDITFEILIPISMAWLMLLLSYFLFSKIGKYGNWSSAQTGALILTAGLANTSFVGFPLLEALRGSESIKVAVINDQLGTFLAFSTIGLFIANTYSRQNQEHSFKKSLLNIIKFPPFLILVTMIILSFSNIYLPSNANKVVSPIAKTLGPLALFAVGFGLKIDRHILKKYKSPLLLAITFKLLLAPLLFFIFYRVILQSQSEMTTITILESAMASMISASVICNEFELEPDLANLMVGITIPLSLITVPLLNTLLS